MQKLLLMVTKATMLERGTFPRHQFDQNGGIVGSSDTATWIVNNINNEISSIEFEIKYFNSEFCLIAHTNNIYINHSSIPITKDAIIKLNSDDVISIANYDFKTLIFKSKTEGMNLQDDLYRLISSPDISDLFPVNQYEYTNLNTLSYNDNEFSGVSKQRIELDPLLLLGKVEENENNSSVLSIDSISSNTYRTISEYINTNIESYEPMIFTNANESLLNDNIACNVSFEASNSNSKKYVNELDIENRNVSEILDPLFFVK